MAAAITATSSVSSSVLSSFSTICAMVLSMDSSFLLSGFLASFACSLGIPPIAQIMMLIKISTANTVIIPIRVSMAAFVISSPMLWSRLSAQDFNVRKMSFVKISSAVAVLTFPLESVLVPVTGTETMISSPDTLYVPWKPSDVLISPSSS